MKKSLLMVAFLHCVSLAFGQHKVAQKIVELQNSRTNFKTISVLSPIQNNTNANINKAVDGATLATLNLGKLSEIVANQYEYIELEIPYQNQIVKALLYKVNPLAYGFHVDTNKDKSISYQAGIYYRGILNGDYNSVASFNFFNGECNGVLSSKTLGNVVVGKLDKTNNQKDYIVYSDTKMKKINQFDCHVKEDAVLNTKNTQNNNSVLSDRCVAIYFEIDYNLYLDNNSDTTTTTNWMTSVFNNIQTLYANDGISVALKSIFIWTELDPYDGIGTSSFDYLQAFNTFRPVFDGDLGQLVGIDPGGLGGVAISIDGLCSQNNYSYSDVDFDYLTVPTFSWTVQVITHELGHLMGSPHTHGCYWNGNNTAIDGCGQQAGYQEGNCAQGPIPNGEGGTIMSYCHLVDGVGINLSNGFGPQPAALVLNTVNSAACLSSDCITSCPNTVVDISATNIDTTSAFITWNDLAATSSWQVSVTPFSSSNIVWNTVNTNSYSVSGLSPNIYYVVRVRPKCEGIESLAREKIVATGGNFCSNMIFTDTGDTTGNYTNMESWTRTMTPYNAGLKIRATFTAFNLEQDYDYLYIYDGNDENTPDITFGGLTGTTNPGVFNSTASDGSLTFKFVSDQAVTASGWRAIISCTGSLGQETSDFLDYSYYPNPTTGKVTISSKDVISEVLVYNLAGQLLLDQKNNGISTSVDISQFASGTYFFKLKINDFDANFKVLKM